VLAAAGYNFSLLCTLGHGLRERLPRHGTFEAAYSNNRRDAIENMVDADSVAACVRELMADRAQWTGSASDLLQVSTSRAARAHSLGGCAGHRPSSAHSGSRLSSAARGGSERAQSG
jgi:hypothetical protein